MTKWIKVPDQVDVILVSRDWRFKMYPRGIMFSVTGHFSGGGVCIDWFRVGPAMPMTWRPK